MFEIIYNLTLDGVMAFITQERQDHALYFDAYVVEIQRRLHDIGGCRCIFVVRYEHDHYEVGKQLI